MSFFACKFRELRNLYGLTQQDLADMLKESTETVSQYESGEKEPTLAFVVSLANIYSVSPLYFIRPASYDSNMLQDYPWQQLMFTPYVLSNTAHMMPYSFADTPEEASIPAIHDGIVQFECGLQPFGFDSAENQETYYNFILFRNDTGSLENALTDQSVSPEWFLYTVHKTLHITDIPFDFPFYDTYNLYYFQRKNGEIIRLRFYLSAGQLVPEDESCSSDWIHNNIQFWFSMQKKERLQFAQSYYKRMMKYAT